MAHILSKSKDARLAKRGHSWTRFFIRIQFRQSVIVLRETKREPLLLIGTKTNQATLT